MDILSATISGTFPCPLFVFLYRGVVAHKSTERQVSVKLSGAEAARVRRVAAMLPHTTVNRIAARAVMFGIVVVERELREAARALSADGQLDAEGL
jgi:hypothetical protein